MARGLGLITFCAKSYDIELSIQARACLSSLFIFDHYVEALFSSGQITMYVL